MFAAALVLAAVDAVDLLLLLAADGAILRSAPSHQLIAAAAVARPCCRQNEEQRRFAEGGGRGGGFVEWEGGMDKFTLHIPQTRGFPDRMSILEITEICLFFIYFVVSAPHESRPAGRPGGHI